jgi:hypothetical protein
MRIGRDRFVLAARDVGIDEQRAQALYDRLEETAGPQDARSVLTDRLARFSDQSGLVLLDYRGLRRFALWPHIGSFWLIPWGLLELVDSESLALLVPGGAALLAGIWLARVAHLAFGAIAIWGSVTMLAERPMFPFFLMAGGIGFVAVGIWLARGDTPIQRWLASRGLPAPQRDLAY